MLEKFRFIGNSLAMLSNRLTQSVATFILTAAIAQILGAHQLGQFLLAISYYYIFVNIASQGLKSLFTRDLSRQPDQIPVYLVSGTLLQLGLSLVAYGALVALISLLPYSAETSTTCYLLGLTIIPFSLSNITESIFQAKERMHLIALSTVPLYLLRLVAMIWAMHLGHGVNYLAGIFCLSEIVILVIEWLFVVRITPVRWEIDTGFMLRTLKAARTFFALDAAGIVAAKMDILILSLLGNELLVGLYGAIAQLIQPYTIIDSSLALAAFPRMTKAVEQGPLRQRQTTETFLELMLLIAIPFWIGLCFFGEDLLTLIYKNAHFSQVSLILSIYASSVILSPFIQVLGYVLIANGYERFHLVEVVITNCVGMVSGIWLVSQYQLLGSAFMRVIICVTACGMMIWAVNQRLFSLRLHKVFGRPLMVAALMVPVLVALQQSHVGILWVLAIATTVYLFLTGCLGFHQLGHPKNFLQGLSK
jgi:O-antigen/teichoic acid export membrane protein